MQKRRLVLEQRARGHRLVPTAGEQKLWAAINAGKLGVSFKRQVVVGERFIVDFLAPSVRLVVEVDGGVHALKGASDARRDRVLARLGYRVVRVPDELVRTRVEEAVALVRAALEGPP